MSYPLLTFTDKGIYCPLGGFYIDPWRRVEKAVITHAHADHSRWGMDHYLAHHDSAPVMRLRLGQGISLQTIGYEEPIDINGVRVSLHPAGHIVGSAQVRVEQAGEVWVVSGDYKIEDDGLATAFEPVRCHSFITESTFGLPVYKWAPQAEIMADINEWWRGNAEKGVASLITAYSLGKAQRILQGVDASIGPIYTHGAVENTNEVLRRHGIRLQATTQIRRETTKAELRNALVIAPPNAANSNWVKRLAPFSLGMASGWMQLRGARRRRAADRGFVLSDHADWDGLNQAVFATGAEQVFVTHGYSEIYSKYLREKGLDAKVVKTEFEGEVLEGVEKNQDQPKID